MCLFFLHFVDMMILPLSTSDVPDFENIITIGLDSTDCFYNRFQVSPEHLPGMETATWQLTHFSISILALLLPSFFLEQKIIYLCCRGFFLSFVSEENDNLTCYRNAGYIHFNSFIVRLVQRLY